MLLAVTIMLLAEMKCAFLLLSFTIFMSFSVNVNITYESHNSIFIRQDLNLRQNNKGRSRNDMFYDNKFSFDRGESLLMLNPELL